MSAMQPRQSERMEKWEWILLAVICLALVASFAFGIAAASWAIGIGVFATLATLILLAALTVHRNNDFRRGLD